MKQPVAKKVTNQGLIGGALDFLSVMPSMITSASSRDSITDEFDGITVDTCYCIDTKAWETGIERMPVEGKWVIVSQYDDEKEARKGHKQWVKYLKENPTCELTDINFWDIPSEGDEG